MWQETPPWQKYSSTVTRDPPNVNASASKARILDGNGLDAILSAGTSCGGKTTTTNSEHEEFALLWDGGHGRGGGGEVAVERCYSSCSRHRSSSSSKEDAGGECGRQFAGLSRYMGDMCVERRYYRAKEVAMWYRRGGVDGVMLVCINDVRLKLCQIMYAATD